jgi:hypothetical protein
MLLRFPGTRLEGGRFACSFNGIVKLNVEKPTGLKPHPAGDGDPVGAALRQAVKGRFDRIPIELEALLQRLDRLT